MASLEENCRRSPNVSAVSAAGWSLTGCHWTVTKRKFYGVRQVDDNTSFRVQLCQLTALWLSLWGPLKISADPCTTNGFLVFHHPPPVVPDPSLSVDWHVPDTGGQPCANSFGLWQLHPAWPPSLFGPTTHSQWWTHGCTVDLSPVTIRPHLCMLACLHWLHVPEKIEFKITVLTCKIVHGLVPGYLGLSRVSTITAFCRHQSPADCRLLVSKLFRSPDRRHGMTSRKTWHQQNHWPHFVTSPHMVECLHYIQ